MSRFGVCQSLYTTIIGPGGPLLGVQICIHEMHYNAEYGTVVHWRYKETKDSHKGDSTEVDWTAWIYQLLDWQHEAADPNEFLDSLRYNLPVTKIFTFTPKGDIITLPADPTPVDFAYMVHIEVGHRCIGAKVDGRLVTLESPLKTGGRVEIFTSKDAHSGPPKDWEEFVKTPRARTKIRQWLVKKRRKEMPDAGRDTLAAEAQRGGLPMHRLLTPAPIKQIVSRLYYVDVDTPYTTIGKGQVLTQHITYHPMAQFLSTGDAEEQLVPRTLISKTNVHNTPCRVDSAGVLVGGSADMAVKLAKYRTPVPGDATFGLVTRGGGASVHRTDCTNTGKSYQEPEHIVEVFWAIGSSGAVFMVTVQVEALDHHRLPLEITHAFSDWKVSILSTLSHTSDDRVAVVRFSFEVLDIKQMGYIFNVLHSIEGVLDVYHITSGQ